MVTALKSHVSQNGAFNEFLSRFIHKDEFFWPLALNGGNQPPHVDAGADQTVGQGAAVQLDGSGSVDPDGTPLSYQWRRVSGLAVTLLGGNTSTPSFTAPIGIATENILTFELIVSDGSLQSLPDHVSVHIAAPESNIAPLASVTASSQNTGTSQQAAKAIDGVVDGYPGDYTREWATLGQGAGAWIQLNWGSAYQIDRVVLHDRPNTNGQITGATLTFSDGSTMAVGALSNNGAGVEVRFGPVAAASLRLTVNTVSGTTINVGLAEIEVYGHRHYQKPSSTAVVAGPLTEFLIKSIWIRWQTA